MGEIIVQIYGIALIYSTMCRLLEPKSKSRRHWMRHLAAAGLLFLIDMLQWYAAVAAAKADSAWVDFVRSISRFATQYMFLAAAHWIFCGSYVKLFFAYFLSGFLFEILFAASQLILTPLRPKEMPWLSFEANSIYTLWLLLSITALGLCLSPLLNRCENSGPWMWAVLCRKRQRRGFCGLSSEPDICRTAPIWSSMASKCF